MPKRETPVSTAEAWAKVVVPLDTSSTAERALPWAAMLARDRAMSVHLLSVWDEQTPIIGLGGGSAVAELRRYLTEIAQRDIFEGIPVTTEVAVGDVADRIAHSAMGTGNLLLLASHGQGGYVESSLGSVADRLVRHLHVPLLVIPAAGAE
jgi:nucleotide-binding universal stress UspA family protein